MRWFVFWILGPLTVLGMGVVALVRDPPDAVLLKSFADEIRARTGYEISYSNASSVALWPKGRIVLRDVRINRPALYPTRGGVVVDAATLSLDFDARQLAQGRRITRLTVDQPTLTLHAADLRNLRARSADLRRQDAPDLVFGLVEVREGLFSYHREASNPDVSFGGINATLTNVNLSQVDKLDATFVWRGVKTKISGNMTRADAQRSEVDITLASKLGQASFEGTVRGEVSTELEGTADITARSINSALRWLDIDPGYELPALAKSATLKGPIVLSGRQLWLKGTTINAPMARGLVDVALDWRSSRLRLSGETRFDSLNLDLLATSPPSLSMPAARTAHTTAHTVIDFKRDITDYLDTLKNGRHGESRSRDVSVSAPPAFRANAGRDPTAARPPIPFETLRALDIDLLQTVKRLTVGGHHVTAATVATKLDDGRLDLDIRQATWAGGLWSGLLAVDARAPIVRHAVRLKGRNADAAVLSEGLFGHRLVDGKARIETDLTAQGDDASQWLASLTGRADFDLREGRFHGYDVAAILRNWLVRRRFDPAEKTPFEKLTGRVRVRDGLLRTVGPVTLRGQKVEIDSSGRLWLHKKWLDQRVRARLMPPPSRLLVPVRISGPWAAPRVALDFGILSTRPGRYALPVEPRRSPRGARVAKEGEAALEALPKALSERIRQALGDPQQRSKMPEDLRDALSKLVN